jgi:hypothetical protein
LRLAGIGLAGTYTATTVFGTAVESDEILGAAGVKLMTGVVAQIQWPENMTFAELVRIKVRGGGLRKTDGYYFWTKPDRGSSVR